MSNRKVFSEDEIVENRLHRFIRKYYRVKIIQGVVLTFSITLISFFILLLGVGFYKLSQPLFDSLVIIFGLCTGAVLTIFVLKPLAQRLGYVKGLNFREASFIIQQKHKTIEDRIVNIIELTNERKGHQNQLYDYAIAQKTDTIHQFNFEEAISLKKLGTFLVRLGILIAVSCITYFVWPDFIKKGLGVIWVGNNTITAVNQVQFVILNDSLTVEAGQDFLLKFRVESVLPVEGVTVQLGNLSEKVNKNSDYFEYLFKAVNSIVSFRISANGIVSEEYLIKILKRPEISGIQLKVIYPGYTSMESIVVEGDGNTEVPAGSRIIWTIKTVNTASLKFISDNDSAAFTGVDNHWKYEKVISKNTNYELVCTSREGLIVNYFYKISIVKDLFPTIDISESRDSAVSEDVYIQGIIQDDYGFTKLEVIEGKSGNEIIKEIAIKKDNIYESFYFTIIPDSNSSVYYFRVYDNDYISGPKFTESRKISIKTISKEERENINAELSDSIKRDMLEGMSAIDKLNKKVSELKMELVVGDLKQWEIQEKMKELNELKLEVTDLLNSISKNDKEFTDNEEILNVDKEITEKAKQLQELMENLLDDEMKELLKQFEELAKEFNAKKADELTDKLEMNLEKLKEQMDMSLELLKKYDLEKDLLKQVDRLNQLSDSLLKDQNPEEKESGKLKEEFKKWEGQYDKNVKQDQEFKKPIGLEKLEEEREEVKKDAEEVEKNSNEKSSKESKSKASKSLKKLAKKMEHMLDSKNSDGESVDIEDVRQIRNSLNDFSIRQEELNNRISRINNVNPTFTAVIKEEKELETKFVSIRDSLKSIGYKQPIITRIIGSELFHVETSLKNLFESYSDNRIQVVRIEQNQIMSEVNMIAVKLDELINSMQEGKGSGDGKPGFMDRKKPKQGDQKGSEKMGEAKAKQQSLKDQLKSSIQKMKAGAGGKRERGEMARMLGEREMMRKALEKMLQEGGIGTNAREKANEALNMMKEVEKDIIYNRLSDQTLEKDNLIKTRLLEAENAEKERENENRRESKEFKGSFEPNRKELDKGLELNRNQEQMLKYNELKLKRFYQEKYLKYIESTKK